MNHQKYLKTTVLLSLILGFIYVTGTLGSTVAQETPRPPTPTSTARIPHTPSALIPVDEGNTLIFSGVVVIRDEYGNPIASEQNGEFPLVGMVDDTYVILYDGIFAYVHISANNASPSISLTPTQRSFPLTGVTTSTTFEDDVPSSAIRIERMVPSEWIAQNASDARYTISFNMSEGRTKRCGPYGYTAYLTYQGINISIVIIDNESGLTIAQRTFLPTLPEDCPRTHTFTTYGSVLLDDNQWRSPRISEIRSWLVENMTMLPSLPPTSTPPPTRTPAPSSTPRPTGTPRPPTPSSTARIPHTPSALIPVDEGNTLIFSGVVVIRDEYGNPIASEQNGEYPFVGMVDDTYVILYDGVFAYVHISAINASPSIPLTPTPDE